MPQITKTGDHVEVRRAGFPVDINTGPAPLGYEAATGIPGCAGDCSQGRRACEHPDVCSGQKAVHSELSAAWRDSAHGPLERMHRQQEPLAWLAAGLAIVAALALLAHYVAGMQ